MAYIMILISFGALFSGIFALRGGMLQSMHLKHAAIVLSIIIAGWRCYISIMHPSDMHVCVANDNICATDVLFMMALSVCQILFHVAIGRDALEYGKGDRRGGYARYAAEGRRRPGGGIRVHKRAGGNY